MKSDIKKIIIIGPTFPYRGGNSLYVSFVYETLSKDFDVKIFNYKLLYPSFLFPGKTQFDVSKKINPVPSERIVNSLNPFNWIKVAAKINSQKPDLIIIDWWHPYFALCHFFISSLINKKLKEKILFITENYISHEGHFIDRVLTRLGLYNAKFFIALSQKVEEELKKNFPEKKIFRSELPIYDHLTDNVEDISNLKTNFEINDDEKVILFFGYVRKYKGLDILIEALNLLKNIDNKIKLLVAGEFYDDKNLYIDLINKYNLSDSVIIRDEYIPNEKVKEYFLVSDVVVLPYRSATQSGILNLAYGFRKPVIVTKVGGLAEFVINESTGLIVEEPKAELIAESIIKFFQTQNRIDYIKNISEFVKSNRFNNLNEIIHKVLEERYDFKN